VKAQAAVAVEPGRIEFREVSVPDPGDADVVVRTRHSWISPGTERSMINGERLDGETPRMADDVLPFPHVPGYQKVGVVEWVGKAVPDIALGSTVFATVSRVDGMFFPTGGHVSQAVTHRSQIWTIPSTIAPVAFSGMVLAQVGVNCASRFTPQPGDAVVILGDGLIGHWAAQTLVAQGARVMLAGKHDERLRFFKAGTADRAVNISHTDPVEVARHWAPDGVLALIDTVGSVPSILPFLPILCHNGHVVSAGFHGAQGAIDIQRLRLRELSLHAPSGWLKGRMDHTRDLIERGVLETERLITHRFKAEDAQRAYQHVLERRPASLGVVLDWD
jgi:bacteriochlorophyllide a dehydrogenase